MKKVGTRARCRQKHADRRKRDRRGDTRPVLASMPRELYSLIKADADERAETAEQRIIAKAEAAFDEERVNSMHTKTLAATLLALCAAMPVAALDPDEAWLYCKTAVTNGKILSDLPDYTNSDSAADDYFGLDALGVEHGISECLHSVGALIHTDEIKRWAGWHSLAAEDPLGFSYDVVNWLICDFRYRWAPYTSIECLELLFAE